MSTSPLPSLSSLATTVIQNLSEIHPPPPEPTTTTTPFQPSDIDPLNPLTNLPTSLQTTAKSLLATLHVLFPHELIPALDILDRKLVLHLSTPSTSETSAGHCTAIYVRSASSALSSSSSRRFPSSTNYNYNYNNNYPSNTNPLEGGYYAIQLPSWNCSCPAFSFSGFGKSLGAASSSSDDYPSTSPADIDTSSTIVPDPPDDHAGPPSFHFGGNLTLPTDKSGIGLPVCKHILAACLAEYAPTLFGHGVERREVGREEFAGWAAGWGN